MSLQQFNDASLEAAAATARACLDIPRWVEEVVSGRPYRAVDDAVAVAQHAAAPFRADEVDRALSHHPRIGERAGGESREAALSRSEQAGLGLDDTVQERLKDANRAYEERFDRVFLIRAAGRTADEILAECQRRLDNTSEQEAREVADQLRQIAVLRLQGALS